MKKKDIRAIDFGIYRGWFAGQFLTAIPDMLEKIMPDAAQELKAQANTAYMDLLTYTQSDVPIIERMNTNPYDYTGISSVFRAPDKAKGEEIKNSAKGLYERVHTIEESAELNQYPGIKSYISFCSDLCRRSTEGEDVAEILYQIPGGMWLNNITVDLVLANKDPEQVDEMLRVIDFEAMAKNALEYYELMQELEDPMITPEKLKSSITKMKELNTKISAQVEHLRDPEVAGVASPFFQDYNTNVLGARGVQGVMAEPANRITQALEQGWDPRYATDYIKLIAIHRDLQNDLTFLNQQENAAFCDPLKQKIMAVLELDPTKQMFYSPEEFVGYYQKYSERLTATLNECKKPEIQQLIASDALNSHALKWKPEITGMHGTMVETLEFFAEKMNFKKHGIIVNDGVVSGDIYTLTQIYNEVKEVKEHVDSKMRRAADLFGRINESNLGEALSQYIEPVKLACEYGASVDRIDIFLSNLIDGATDYRHHNPELVGELITFANDMKNGLKNPNVVPKGFDVYTPLATQQQQAEDILPNIYQEGPDKLGAFADSFSQVPRKTRLDYRFISTVASNIAITSGVMQFAKNRIDQKYSEEAYTLENLNMQSLKGYDLIGEKGVYRPNPYYVGLQPGLDNQAMANSFEQYTLADQQIATLKEHIIHLQNEEAFKGKAGIQSYFNMNLRLLTDAEQGIDRGLYMSRIPGSYYLTSFPDWTGKNADPNHSVEEFEAMINDMGYADAWDDLSERVDLEIENDHKALTQEEANALRERIKNVNTRLIADYKRMKDPSNEKYAKFFQNYKDTVVGARGVDVNIERLEEQNAMLDAGWDPTRISDYRMLQHMSQSAEKAQKRLEEINHPQLAELREKYKKLAELDPSNQIFASQAKFDAYYADYSAALCNLLKVGKSDAVKAVMHSAEIQNRVKDVELLEAFASDTNINSTLVAAKIDAVFDNINLPAQKLKGKEETILERKASISQVEYASGAKHLENRGKTAQLKDALEEARVGLYKKHRIGFGGASSEMTLLREKTDTLYRMITTEKRLIDDPMVVRAAKELSDAQENYDHRKRAAAGALDNPDWQPKTEMGKARFASSNQIKTILGTHFNFNVERERQIRYGGEIPEESYFGAKLRETQYQIINGAKEGPEVLKNIAKVIAIQTLAHKCMEDNMDISRFSDSVLEDSTKKILKSPGFKKMIPNPQDPSSDGLTKAIVNAAHNPGNLMADYFDSINQIKQVNGPANAAQKQGPVLNGPL